MESRICVVGTGYVGMACAVGLANLGWKVVGYDIQPDRIEKLKRGMTPYREIAIEEQLCEYFASDFIRLEETLEITALDTDVITVAPETPSEKNGSADLSALNGAIAQLCHLNLQGYPTIVICSTAPPGTCDRMANAWAAVMCAPNIVREGSAVRDFLNLDRIVVEAEFAAPALSYFRLFENSQRPIVFRSRCNAEIIKSYANAFLALKVSLANEAANPCDAVGGAADDVLRVIVYDRRIGSDFLSPGIGFGGRLELAAGFRLQTWDRSHFTSLRAHYVWHDSRSDHPLRRVTVPSVGS